MVLFCAFVSLDGSRILTAIYDCILREWSSILVISVWLE